MQIGTHPACQAQMQLNLSNDGGSAAAWTEYSVVSTCYFLV